MVETIVTIVVALLVIVGALLIFAASKPNSFRVERSLAIAAPAEKIFALVNDLRSHGVWSPWEKKDPAMKRTYSGAASGKGAIYEWDGNKNIGQGRMEIMDETPPNRVVFKMDFFRPFKAHNTAEMTLEPQGDGTRVTWAIYGPSPLTSKVIGLFISMDSMIGKEFEAGLANLKTLTER
jgi:uncharacterized protein YndB with AHSA1/START domain